MSGPADHLSRSYRHPECGGVTVASGDDYVMLECPFRPVQQTFCATCRRFVELNDVKWVGSNETIEEYRNELYYSVPFKTRLYYQFLGNAYEGALRLRLNKKGAPLPPE